MECTYGLRSTLLGPGRLGGADSQTTTIMKGKQKRIAKCDCAAPGVLLCSKYATYNYV